MLQSASSGKFSILAKPKGREPHCGSLKLTHTQFSTQFSASRWALVSLSAHTFRFLLIESIALLPNWLRGRQLNSQLLCQLISCTAGVVAAKKEMKQDFFISLIFGNLICHSGLLSYSSLLSDFLLFLSKFEFCKFFIF